MKTRKERLLWLYESPQISRSIIKKLLMVDPLLERPFSCSPNELSKLLQISTSHAAIIFRHIHEPNIMKKLDINLQPYDKVKWFDDHYPRSLRNIPDPPLVLYLLGDSTLLKTPLSLSVIGTRKPSSYAFPAMGKVLLPLIEHGFTIVSGMAQGVDQYAHQLAVEHRGRTIAVLGSGFRHIYPKNNPSLFNLLASNHLIISEYPPDYAPKKVSFP